MLSRRKFLCYSFALLPTQPSAVKANAANSQLTLDKIAVRPFKQSVEGIRAFDTWFGRPADYIFTFGGIANRTNYVQEVDHIIDSYQGDVRPKIWAIGLTVFGIPLKSAANGELDEYYKIVAKKIYLDAPADGPILIRPGHEFNLRSYPWNVTVDGKPEEFVKAFIRFTDIFRSTSSRFNFIWNPNWVATPNAKFDLAPCYPGDGYVDMIATDLYYDSATDSPNPRTKFDQTFNMPYSGLRWICNFAKAHNKPMAIGEFGINWDKPEWIDLMYQFGRKYELAYQGYWDSNSHFNGRLSDGSNPKSGQRFKTNYRNGGAL